MFISCRLCFWLNKLLQHLNSNKFLRFDRLNSSFHNFCCLYSIPNWLYERTWKSMTNEFSTSKTTVFVFRSTQVPTLMSSTTFRYKKKRTIFCRFFISLGKFRSRNLYWCSKMIHLKKNKRIIRRSMAFEHFSLDETFHRSPISDDRDREWLLLTFDWPNIYLSH